MADEEQFESAVSGASETVPKQCSGLRKNEYVVIKSRPCKIVEMSTSKTGKHGHAKVHLVGLDVFTGKKYEDICPSTHNMNCPVVTRTEYTVINDTSDGFLSLMDDQGTVREDLKMPPADTELYGQMKERLANLKEDNFMVTVLKAMGTEQVVGIRQDKGEKP